MVLGIGKRLKKRKEKKKLKKTIFEQELVKVEKKKTKAETAKIRRTAKTSARLVGIGVPKFAATRIGGGVGKVRGFQKDIKFVGKEFGPASKALKKRSRGSLLIKTKRLK